MTILTWKDEEIGRLADQLGFRVRKAFREIVKEEAEDVANDIIDNMGLEEVCRDIDEAITEHEELIHNTVDRLTTYIFDNYMIATFPPYPEDEEVDEDLIKELSCGKEFSMDRVVGNFAYEVWRIGLIDRLKEILKEKCKEAGLLRKSLLSVRG